MTAPRRSGLLFHLIQWCVYHEDHLDDIAMWAIILVSAVSVALAWLLGGP